MPKFFSKKDELRILSEEHPDSVRVKMIGEQIVEALESDLKAMKSENVSVAHLRGLEWEFVVGDMPVVGAYCLAGGKIVVYRAFLEQIKSNRCPKIDTKKL
ncbi:hypothetical protein POM88_014441 [Heracleum sosnowskyi]|uniref:Uncharacterized protein n=1 Tax=Heracleum sosnowskyi TaxID=360622 RepID=A0AAD8MYZ5_9APIA|nr:hypothetical protein POM88_014441 [Heracleum sosnowskyi]